MREKELSKKEMHILLHSLGLTYQKKPFRNHFCTGEGSVDYPLCEMLVNKGLMEKRQSSICKDTLYFVTDKGIDIAKRKVKECDLKPCPFCGDEEIELKCIDREMLIYALVCKNEDCGVQGTKFQICSHNKTYEILQKVKADASKLWNKRIEIKE